MNLAIITARGGSKRIPHKNIREFLGKPMLLWPLEAAQGAGCFDEIMVSTDDEEIAAIAMEGGAKVPFLRSAETSGDMAGTDAVIEEVLREYAARGVQVDRFCCIYPTAPFLKAERLRDAMNMLDNCSSVSPVVQFSYPPQRGFIINNSGSLERQFPQFQNTRSQDLPPIYHDAGQFYACRTADFMKYHTTDTPDMKPLILPEAEVQDIDTESDWLMAEMKMKLLLN